MASRTATITVALLIAAITLPLQAHWLDFEPTRRALAGVVIGVALIASALHGGMRRIRGGLPLMFLCVYATLRCIDATNTGEALLRSVWYTTLAMAVLLGAQVDRRVIAHAVIPTGLLLALLVIAQQAGMVGLGLGRPGDAVGTLGNRNAAAEVLVLVFALTAWLVGLGDREPLAILTLCCTAVALGANGTRAALLAAVVTVAVLVWARRGALRSRRTSLLGLALVLAALGVMWRGGAGESAPPPPATVAGTTAPAPSTIDVRLALWRGVGAMILDAPLLGHGTGQLRFDYPRYRRQEEIEASTFGRRFPTVVESAHDDLLELAAELGVVGLLLLGWYLLTALHGTDLASLAVLAAFAVPALLRSPLGNAPAALLLGLWIGSLSSIRQDPWTVPLRRRNLVLVMFGASLIWLSSRSVIAASDVAAWIADGDIAALDAAIELHPSEPRYRSLRIQSRCGGVEADGTLTRRGAAEYAACRGDLQALARIDPSNTNALFLTAQLAQGAGARDVARAALTNILTLDPREPRAQLLAAVLLFQEQHYKDAIATLYADPHPRLREKLAGTLSTLATTPELKDDAGTRGLFAREAAFVRAIDACVADPIGAATQSAIAAFANASHADDPRVAVLRAHGLLAVGKAAEADALSSSYAVLNGSARRLLAPVTDGLRALPHWSAALEAAHD